MVGVREPLFVGSLLQSSLLTHCIRIFIFRAARDFSVTAYRVSLGS